jgi:hypothetical protein
MIGNPFASPPEFDLQKNPVDPLDEQRKQLYGSVLEWIFVKYSVFKIVSERDMKELEGVYTKCMNTKAEDKEGYSFFSEKLVTADVASGDRIIVKWGKWKELVAPDQKTKQERSQASCSACLLKEDSGNEKGCRLSH